MAFLDRLRGRRNDGGGEASGGSPAPGTRGTQTAGSAGDTAPGPSAASATPVAVAAWFGLPPLRRTAADGPAGVADAAFGRRLPTWQDPSFTRRSSPAVLDPSAAGALLSGAPHGAARPVPGLERPAPALPSGRPAGAPAVQRMPVAPLRAVPVGTPPPAATGTPSVRAGAG
ncbi:hypothetical protein ABZW32_39460, partial [Streptomyces sp. NPDC004667]